MLEKSLILILFVAITVYVGLISRKKAVDVAGYVLGGRNMGSWMTAFAYGTTYFSAVVFVGYAGQFGWKYGISSIWIGLGNAFIGSLLAWLVLGRRTRVMTHHLDAATMPEFFGKRYNSNNIKILSSAIIFIFLVPYTASIYNGLSRLFGMAFDVPYMVCVIAMALLTGIYVVLGGYVATAINDFIQGIVMLVGIVVVIWAVLSGQGGFLSALQKLSIFESDIPITAGQAGAFTSFFGPDPINLLGVVILTSLGTWGLPQMVHKFYTIKNEKAISTGTVVSTSFALIVAGGCYFLGSFGRLFDNPSLYNPETGGVVYDAVVPFMLSTLPDILIGVVVILVFSASMSTLSSLVLTSSSTLTLDFIKDNLLKEMSEKTQLIYIKFFVMVFILISVFLALNPPTFIAQLMSISWGALAGSFLAPFLYGLYWKRVSRTAVWASFICGVGLTISNMLFKFIASPINAGAAAMLLSLLIVPLITILVKNKDEQYVKEIFNCYDETVVVSKRVALSQNGNGEK